MKNKYTIISGAISGLIFLTGCQKEPEACFNPNKTTVKINEEVTFTNCSKDANSFEWDFSDGNLSSKENTSHSFNSVGSYSVELKVTSKNGKKSSTVQHTIKVEDLTTSEKLIGKWSFESGSVSEICNSVETSSANIVFTNSSLEFKENGQYLSIDDDGTTESGSWSVDNAGNIILDNELMKIVSLNENTLELRRTEDDWYDCDSDGSDQSVTIITIFRLKK